MLITPVQLESSILGIMSFFNDLLASKCSKICDELIHHFCTLDNIIHLWVFYEHQHMKSGTSQCHMMHCRIQSFFQILAYCKYKIEVEHCFPLLFHIHFQFCPSSLLISLARDGHEKKIHIFWGVVLHSPYHTWYRPQYWCTCLCTHTSHQLQHRTGG